MTSKLRHCNDKILIDYDLPDRENDIQRKIRNREKEKRTEELKEIIIHETVVGQR